MDGRELARRYAREVVEPLLTRHLPGMRCSTARLGSGSDVLGLDDATSRDHDWGLRLTLIVPDGETAHVDALLERELPATWGRLPTRFATTWDPVVRQRVDVTTAGGLARTRAGVDLSRAPTLLEKVSATGQCVLEVIGGPVFRDDDGVLAGVRDRIGAMPDEVRAWAIASAWTRLGQELPLVRRTASRGDDVGSAVLAARLAQTAMRLGFLLERRWSPYAKWVGTAFAALPAASAAADALRTAVTATDARQREEGLVVAVRVLGGLQGERGLPPVGDPVQRFWDRPSRTVTDVAGVVMSTVSDPTVRRLPLLGPPDLWTDDVRLLTDHGMRRSATAAALGLPPDRPR